MDSVLVLCDIALYYNNKIAEAYLVKGDYYSAKGIKEQALLQYDNALKINPNAWEGYIGKAYLYENDEGIPLFENLYKALSLNPGSETPELLRRIAGAYS
jgi:tetratricopeptide (TPR) repeat protein